MESMSVFGVHYRTLVYAFERFQNRAFFVTPWKQRENGNGTLVVK